MKKILFTIAVIVIYSASFGLNSIQGNSYDLNLEEIEVLSNHFQEGYKVFELKPINGLYVNLSENIDNNIELILENDSYTFDLYFNELRAINYFHTYSSINGIEKQKEYTLRTFEGKSRDGYIARFSVWDDFFEGVFIYDIESVTIEQLSRYLPSASNNLYIMYDSESIKDDYFCEVDSNLTEAPFDTRESNGGNKELNCNSLEIAVDSDFEFFQKNNSNYIDVYDRVFHMLNIVEGAYFETFNMEFAVTFQNVWIDNAQPYNTTNSSGLLQQFRIEWTNSYPYDVINRDIAHLFTGKRLDDNVAGRAFLSSIRDGASYGLTMERIEMYTTLAHEIGHNLSATHPPNIPYCLCGSTDASLMCQGLKDTDLWFCPDSEAEILTFFLNNQQHFDYVIPTYLILTNSPTEEFSNYEVTNIIFSSQTINNTYTVYQIGKKAELGAKFEVENKSKFEIIQDKKCN